MRKHPATVPRKHWGGFPAGLTTLSCLSTFRLRHSCQQAWIKFENKTGLVVAKRFINFREIVSELQNLLFQFGKFWVLDLGSLLLLRACLSRLTLLSVPHFTFNHKRRDDFLEFNPVRNKNGDRLLEVFQALVADPLLSDQLSDFL